MAAANEETAMVKLDALLAGSSPWARVVLLAPLLALLLGALYWQTLRDLALQWWDDPNYTHGFMVPVFSGYLVWRQRARLAALEPRGSTLGLPVLLAGIAALLIGDLGAELFLTRSSLIVVLAGLILFHLGTAIFRVVVFPLVFLFFMVPLPAIIFYAITFPLQSLAARQAAWVLDLLGVPVILDGNVIHLSQLSLGVTEACSGIRSLISLLGGAVAWAYLALPRGWMTLVFVASTVPITILANAGRVISTGLIGQWFGVQYASGYFHIFSGWAVFVFAFVCLFAVHGLLCWARGRIAKPRA
jgi:exosortase